MPKTPYDSFHPDLKAVRQIFFDWLRANPGVEQLSNKYEYFEQFVELVEGSDPYIFPFHIYEVFWQLVLEEILIPGKDPSNNHFPWFRLTAYGAKIIKEEFGHPHDQTGYLKRIQDEIQNPDPTVIAYLSESLHAYRHGSPIAASLLLGIAAERVFLLVYDSVKDALANPTEKRKFEQKGSGIAMKPKLDLLHRKLQDLQGKGISGYPDNAVIMVTAVYDLMRCQRNDLGHPRAAPPNINREDAFNNLVVFRGYYKTAEDLRKCLPPGSLP